MQLLIYFSAHTISLRLTWMFVICGSLTASAVKVKVIAQIHCVKLWIHKILGKMSTALNQAMPPPEDL